MDAEAQSKGVEHAQIQRFVDLIKDEALKKKVLDLLADPTTSIEGEVYRGLPLETSPAAKLQHHSYPRGLVQHMVSAATISLTLCDVVERVYGAQVKRDVVIAVALIHDIMKPLTYSETGEKYGVSPLGERIDHLTLAVAELIRRGFPLDVVHAVAAHHGKGGPMSPRTLEALICSLADSADASLNGEVLSAARWAIRDCIGEEAHRLGVEEAFAIVRARQERGCAGVVETVKKMRSEEEQEKI